MGKDYFSFLAILFFLATVLSAGCTSSKPVSGVPSQEFGNVTASRQIVQNASVSPQNIQNTSAHDLTAEMRSQAIAIALNNTKIQYYRDNLVQFNVTSVVIPEKPFLSVVEKKVYERYFPVVRITTATEYLNMYIDLERQEIHAVERYFTYSDFSDDPEILAILDSASDEEKGPVNRIFLGTNEPPCTKLINVLRKKNATYDQITALLELNGYWWVPGDYNPSCGTGHPPSAEERELWTELRGAGYNPYGS